MSEQSKQRTSKRIRRLRRVFGVLVVIILLLLIGVTALFLRAIAPAGGPDERTTAAGMTWVRSIYGYGKDFTQQLKGPNGVAIADDGTIWVADTGNSRAIAFGPDGRYRSLIHFGPAYSNPKALVAPTGIAVDEQTGNIWIVDFGRDLVGVYSPDNEVIAEHAVPNPGAVAVRDGRVVVGAAQGFVIMDTAGKPIRLVGTKGRGKDQFDTVNGVAIGDDGTIYVTDLHNNRLRAFDRNGKPLWSKSLGDPSNTGFGITQESTRTAALKYKAQLPEGVTLDGAGRPVFMDTFGFQILVSDQRNGDITASYGEMGAEDSKFAYPVGIAYDPARDWFAVADTANNRIQIVRLPGSGGNALDALRRYSDAWRICCIPLLLILIAIAIAVIGRVRRRRREQAATQAANASESATPASGEGVESAEVEAPAVSTDSDEAANPGPEPDSGEVPGEGGVSQEEEGDVPDSSNSVEES